MIGNTDLGHRGGEHLENRREEKRFEAMSGGQKKNETKKRQGGIGFGCGAVAIRVSGGGGNSGNERGERGQKC